MLGAALGLVVVVSSLSIVLSTILHGGKCDPTDQRPQHLRPKK